LYAAALQAAPRTLLVLGDSLSAAHGIEGHEGWTTLLEKRLKPDDWRVFNASISGETTAGGLARLPALLQAHSPSIVLIELGANDGLRALPLAQIRANLRALIKTGRDSKARVLLVGMRIPPNYGPVYARGFEAIYSDLAAEFKVPLVPFLLEGVAGQDAMMQTDDMHPLAEGQPRMLENVWPYLRPLLR
jgi:acyl-CoA thioesterase-1